MPVAVIRPPSDGLDTTSAPFAASSATRGVSLVNMLPGRPGKLVPRGSVNWQLTLANTGVGGYLGDRVLVQLATGNFQLVDLTGVSPTAAGASFARPGLVQQVGGNSPGSGVPFISQAIVGDYTFIRANSGGIVRWDGTTTAAGFLNLANGPQGASAVASHLSRVFAVGGTPPGGGTADLNTLYWTDPGGPGADLLTGWQDDVSGLVNRLKLNLPSGDSARALVPFQRQLLVFGQRYIVAITGSTPSAFQQQIVASVGCARNPGSVCATTDGVYFMSEDGLCLWDGVELKRLYNNVYTRLDATSPRWTIAEMSDQYLLLGHQSEPQMLYHIPTGSWSGYTGPRAYLGLVKTTNYRAGWSATGFDSLDRMADPEYSLLNGDTLGIDHTGAFTCSATSSAARLAEPLHQANIRRFAPRYALYDAAAGSAARLTVQLRDPAGTVLSSAQYAPHAGSNYAVGTATEAFVECITDLSVTWTLTVGAATLDSVPEIHDCYVEWDQAYQ